MIILTKTAFHLIKSGVITPIKCSPSYVRQDPSCFFVLRPRQYHFSASLRNQGHKANRPDVPKALSQQEQYTLFEKRLEAVAYAKKHGTFAAAATFGCEPVSVLRWLTKEAAYERELCV